MSKNQIVSADYATVYWAHTYDPKTRVYSGDNIRPDSFADPLADTPPPRFATSLDEALDSAAKAAGQNGMAQHLLDGWSVSSGGALQVEAMPPAMVADAIATRRKQVELWRASGDERFERIASIMESVWGLVTKTGKPATNPPAPKWVANMGYRRSYAIPGVFYIRSLRATDGDYTYDVLVEPVEYQDPRTKLLAHFRENLRPGSSAYSPVDLLAGAWQLSQCIPAGKEADLVRQGVKRGTAQKLFRWVTLASLHRGADLIGRCLAPAPTERDYVYTPGGWIPFRRVDKEATQKMITATKESSDYDTDALERDLVTMLVGTNRPKMADREAITKTSENHQAEVVREIAAAFLSPETARADHYGTARAAAILNAAAALVKGQVPKLADAGELCAAARAVGIDVVWDQPEAEAEAEAEEVAEV